jgi:hypothetical protein
MNILSDGSGCSLSLFFLSLSTQPTPVGGNNCDSHSYHHVTFLRAETAVPFLDHRRYKKKNTITCREILSITHHVLSKGDKTWLYASSELYRTHSVLADIVHKTSIRMWPV